MRASVGWVLDNFDWMNALPVVSRCTQVNIEVTLFHFTSTDDLIAHIIKLPSFPTPFPRPNLCTAGLIKSKLGYVPFYS